MFDVGLLVVNTEKRKNHESDRVRQLLAVPRYADILESRAAGHEGKDEKDFESLHSWHQQSVWRRELAK